MRAIWIAWAMVIVGAVPLRAAAEKPGQFDWDRWRELPVQNGGRYKPLDTAAWEMLRLISNRSSFTDPESGQKLDPTVLYLSMLFEWQGWNHTNRDQLLFLVDWRPQYARLHRADKWDQAPLLRIDWLELRTALGLEKDQEYISPAALNKCLFEDSQTARTYTITKGAAAIES
jgi:hypothetical protein